MRRKGSATKVVLLIAAIVVLGAGALGVWWWKGQEDPAEEQMVTDATAAVAAYLVEKGDPKLGNFERITGAGFDHTQYGNPPKRVLRAARVAHFTTGTTNENHELELIILIVPPPEAGTGKVAVQSTAEEGRKIIVTHPKYRG